MIDWNSGWREAQRTRLFNGPEAWDERAPSFASHADPGYAEQILRLIEPDPSWTVLDVGSGPGTLAVPLARRTTAVTALDFSPAMLDLLRARCVAERIGNVAAVLGRWEEDWDALGIGVHDLAIASRSLAVDDLRASLAKLDARARRAICLCTAVGDGPRDRRIVEAVGRSFHPPPDYLHVYCALREMGICADVALIGREEWRVYESVEAAATTMAAVLRGLTEEERDRLTAYLRATLTPHQGGFRLPAPRPVRWAVLWWRKAGPQEPNVWRSIHRPEAGPGRQA